MQTDRNVLDHGEPRKHSAILKCAPHAERGDLVDRLAAQLDVVEPNLAGRSHVAADRVEECRLAGSVGADYRANLSRRDLEADVGHGTQACELHANILELEPRGHGAAPR